MFTHAKYSVITCMSVWISENNFLMLWTFPFGEIQGWGWEEMSEDVFVALSSFNCKVFFRTYPLTFWFFLNVVPGSWGPRLPAAPGLMAPVQVFPTHVINSKPNWQLQTINGQVSILVGSPLLITSVPSQTAPYDTFFLSADVGARTVKFTSPLWGSVSSSSKWKSKCCNVWTTNYGMAEAPSVRVPSTLSQWYALI